MLAVSRSIWELAADSLRNSVAGRLNPALTCCSSNRDTMATASLIRASSGAGTAKARVARGSGIAAW